MISWGNKWNQGRQSFPSNGNAGSLLCCEIEQQILTQRQPQQKRLQPPRLSTNSTKWTCSWVYPNNIGVSRDLLMGRTPSEDGKYLQRSPGDGESCDLFGQDVKQRRIWEALGFALWGREFSMSNIEGLKEWETLTVTLILQEESALVCSGVPVFFFVVFFLNFKRPLIVLVASTHQLCNCAYRSGIHLCLGFFFSPFFMLLCPWATLVSKFRPCIFICAIQLDHIPNAAV